MYLTVYSVSWLFLSSKRAKLVSLLKRVRKESLLQSAVLLRETVLLRQTALLRGTVLLRRIISSEKTVLLREAKSEAVSRLNKL